MYNTDLPRRADLPTSSRLWWSTILAAFSAIAILTTLVLPSEYGIDPTGVGRVLGLTQMGEIKMQLAREAQADREVARRTAAQKQFDPGDRNTSSREIDRRLAAIERRLDDISVILSTGIGRAVDQGPESSDGRAARVTESSKTEVSQIERETQRSAVPWTDEISITLGPGEGVEYKLVMQQGAEADFEWTANGSMLNYDTHGDGGGNSISYEKGRGVPEQSGTIRAAFTGNHGWFWRNRTNEPVTLTLRTRGAYSELKRTV